MAAKKPTLCYYATKDQIGKARLREYFHDEKVVSHSRQKNVYFLGEQAFNNTAKSLGIILDPKPSYGQYYELRQGGVHELIELLLRYDGLTCREIVASFDKPTKDVLDSMRLGGFYGSSESTACLKKSKLIKKFDYLSLYHKIGLPEDIEFKLNQGAVTDECNESRLVLQALLYPPRQGFTEFRISGEYGKQVTVVFNAPKGSDLEKICSNRYIIRFDGELGPGNVRDVALCYMAKQEYENAVKNKRPLNEHCIGEAEWLTMLRSKTFKLKERTNLFKSLTRDMQREIKGLTVIDKRAQ